MLPVPVPSPSLDFHTLALGLLVGIERYKSRADGEKKIAGVRTFPLIAMLGVLCAERHSYFSLSCPRMDAL